MGQFSVLDGCVWRCTNAKRVTNIGHNIFPFLKRVPRVRYEFSRFYSPKVVSRMSNIRLLLRVQAHAMLENGRTIGKVTLNGFPRNIAYTIWIDPNVITR
jgi:hypothetical protein